MVTERRYVFEVEDISGLGYICPSCKTETVFSIKGCYEPNTHCSSCSEALMPPNMDRQDLNITVLKNLRALLRFDSQVRLRFIVPDPDEHP